MSGAPALSSPERSARLARTLRRHAAEGRSGEMTLMYLLAADPDLDRVIAFTTAAARADSPFSPQQRALAARTRELIEAHRSGCARIAAMLASGMDSDAPAESVEAGLAFSRRLFDWSVRQDAEASVALYSLGSPAILRAATDEIVRALSDWTLLGPERRVLDIGCGTGRMEQALAGRVGAIHGIDLSAHMIEVARDRCAGLRNVTLEQSDGRDLAALGDATFELVLSVDAFPYVVQSGLALAERYFQEAARVLVPGGAFAIFEFSYRGERARDRVDVSRLAADAGLIVERDDPRPFRLWDGAAFVMRRPARPPART